MRLHYSLIRNASRFVYFDKRYKLSLARFAFHNLQSGFRFISIYGIASAKSTKKPYPCLDAEERRKYTLDKFNLRKQRAVNLFGCGFTLQVVNNCVFICDSIRVLVYEGLQAGDDFHFKGLHSLKVTILRW